MTIMEHKPYEELKNMVQQGGRKHQMEALTYGHKKTIDDLRQSDDKEVAKFAEHLDNHPELQVDRQHVAYQKTQKDIQSYQILGRCFLGVAILMYLATITLFFLPYLLYANHGLYYFLGAFVTLLVGGALVGCYFMIARPKLRYARNENQISYQNLDYAKRFQTKMQAWIEEGRYN